jgi:VanZ family protein
MEYVNKFLIPLFYIINLVLIIFYLYPGSILGCFLYDDCSTQPQITKDFIISSNHFYAFIILSTIGIYNYRDKKKIKFLIIYLFLLSIILELLHIVIPGRSFELKDLFGNILGVMLVIIIYKIRGKYA